MSIPFGTYDLRKLLPAVVYTARFYPVYHDLKGRNVKYRNPGESLFSLIVAKHLRDLYVTLLGDAELQAKECIDFSLMPSVTREIFTKLIEQAHHLLLRIEKNFTNFDGPVRELTSIDVAAGLTYVRDIQDLVNDLTGMSEFVLNQLRDLKGPLEPPLTGFCIKLYQLQDKMQLLQALVPETSPSPSSASPFTPSSA